MVQRGRKPKGSCRLLKARIGKATTKKTRGKALGEYSKAGCTKHKRKRRHSKKR